MPVYEIHQAYAITIGCNDPVLERLVGHEHKDSPVLLIEGPKDATIENKRLLEECWIRVATWFIDYFDTQETLAAELTCETI